MTDDSPKHPGKILFDEAMTPLGVSRNKLARDIDVPVGRISDIVAGKRGVTPDTALRFAKYFGTTAELWLRLQADYDLHVVRTTTWLKTEPKVAVLEPAPEEAEAVPPVTPPRAVTPSESVAETETAMPAPTAPPSPQGQQPENQPSADQSSYGDDADTDADDDADIDIPDPVPGRS